MGEILFYVLGTVYKQLDLYATGIEKEKANDMAKHFSLLASSYSTQHQTIRNNSNVNKSTIA
jgi:hypothetical protein